MERIDDFFAFARERHSIFLRRAAGRPAPWTEDPILRTYKFTNVFRELDRTTQWFADHVRGSLLGSSSLVLPPEQLLLATVVFRWLNRIATGEAIFLQLAGNGQTAFRLFYDTGDATHLHEAIVAYCGNGPYVTGAYMIKSPTGMTKLDGMMHVLEKFYRERRPMPLGGGGALDFDWREMTDILRTNLTWADVTGAVVGLECVWDWLRRFDFQGPFHAYEVVTDLQHTQLLKNAPDITTWANPGPGAQRGLARIHVRENPSPRKPKHKWKPTTDRGQLIDEMREILALASDPRYWPQYRPFLKAGDGLDDKFAEWKTRGYKLEAALQRELGGHLGLAWPRWEMREVEHALCEFDKYERVRTGEGVPRGRYSGGGV